MFAREQRRHRGMIGDIGFVKREGGVGCEVIEARLFQRDIVFVNLRAISIRALL